MTGNQIVVRAALAAGLKAFFGYPITPSTEILHFWAKAAEKYPSLSIRQTEDETSAGFGVCGAVLAGTPAFTATAGPGSVLMQDPLVMAEAMRLPMATIFAQRGGPSTGTVIYSQQEVNLACFGGNGEGWRLVYSAASLPEIYHLLIKGVRLAWRWRFPVILLIDGYLAKTEMPVRLPDEFVLRSFPAKPILSERHHHLRNCYSTEEDLALVIAKNQQDYQKMSQAVAEAEMINCFGSRKIIFAHGSVAAAAKIAVEKLRSKKRSIGLFRPITLRPFPVKTSRQVLHQAEEIIVVESSAGQFLRLIEAELGRFFSQNKIKISSFLKPAEAITSEEIINFLHI